MQKRLLTLAVTAALLTSTTQLHAAGFQLAEYSSTGLGRAFAGEAAMRITPLPKVEILPCSLI